MSTQLAYPLVSIAVLLLGLVVVSGAAVRARRRRTPDADAVALARPDRLAASTWWRRRVAVYRTLLVLAVLVTLAAFVAAAQLAARPVQRDPTDTRLRVRDVMLCLDVSSSMTAANREVLRVYERLVRSFDGERVGLTLFNGAPVTVFPLTTDYDVAVQQLTEVRTALGPKAERDGPIRGILRGTTYGDIGASLSGDGLATCTARLVATETEGRSASVVLATDNAVGGRQTIDLPSAADLARGEDVRVYGLDASTLAGTSEPNATEFRTAVEATGGAYFPLADSDSVTQILDDVRARQAAAVPSAPRLVERDRPGVAWAVLAMAGSVLVLLAWRLRR